MPLSLAQPAFAAAGDDSPPLTFEAIYSVHFRGVWRTLRRLGVGDGQLDDAAQDVFVIVYRKLRGFDGRSLRSWLYAITVRVASDYRRAAAQRQSIPLSESVAGAMPCPDRASELQESLQLLHAVLAELDEKKRTAFVLSELEQLSVPEIAEVLGENANTVYSRVRSARAEFDAQLTKRRRRDKPSGGSR